MASFRRSLSPMASTDRALYNGDMVTHKFSSSPSSASPSSSSLLPIACLRAFLYGNHLSKSARPSEKPKIKIQVWKRPLIHFLLSFFVGFMIGFTPFGMEVFSANLSSKQHQPALELNAARIGSKEDFGHVGRTIDTVNMANLKDSGLEPQKVLSEQVALDVADPSTEHSPAAISISELVPRKLLIIVTPTYNRPFQAFYLNRLAHTLKLVPPPLLWIVVELGSQSVETAELLRKTGVMYRHIVCEKNATDIKDRGTYQRNTALAHIEHHRLDGIVYFADDDNVYTLQLFEQIRNIRRFGTWPVGMLAHSKNKAILEGPVCTGKQVIGWHTNEKSKRLRRFHVDMSGFAFNSTILWDPQRWGRHSSRPIRQLDTVKEGFQETTFIEQVVEDEFQMEGVPENCSKIMVWHLHLEAPQLVYPPGWIVDKNLDVVVPVKMSTDRML